MGLAERDYCRDPSPTGFRMRSPRSIVTTLIIINVAIFLFDYLFTSNKFWLSDLLAMKLDSLTQPWNWWQLLTSGFAHSPDTIYHVGGNMLVLFFFGRDIENIYGRKEFLRLYLTMIVLASLSWALFAKFIQGAPTEVSGPFGEMLPAMCYGASGAVSGIFILFVLHYPRRQVLLFFVIPAPAWVAGALIILWDMFSLQRGTSNIAHSAHLAGFAFALAYYFGKWNLSRLIPGQGRAASLNSVWKGLKRRPKLRVHAPGNQYLQLDDDADRVLDKLHSQGEESLSPSERRILEEYSRRMRQKHS